MSQQHPYRPGETVTYDIHPHYILSKPEEFMDTEEIEELDALVAEMSERALEPSPRLQTGLQLARQEFNSLRKRLGYEPVDHDDLEIVLLSNEDFQELSKKMDPRVEYQRGGFACERYNQVLVDADIYPDYITASVVLHEWLHKHMEMFTVAQTNVPDSEGEPEKRDEQRRSGLSVSRASKHYETRGSEVGILLNELPNYVYQRRLMQMLLEQEEFAEERLLLERRRRANDTPADSEHNNYYIDCRVQGDIFRVSFPGTDLHFDNEGNPSYNTSPFYCMLLAHEICNACGEVDGRPFEELWMQAKANPRLQNVIRRRMNEVFGPRFYQRLRQCDDTDVGIIPILVEVQGILRERGEGG